MRQLFKLLIIFLGVIPVLTFSQPSEIHLANKNYIYIEYSSICCGTPSEKPVMDFVSNFEAEHKLSQFEILIERGLGKEGEHAFYIGTDHLHTQLLQSLIDGLNTTISKQNKARLKNKDGHVTLETELVLNVTNNIIEIV